VLAGGALAAGCGAGFNAASLNVRPNSGSAQDGSLKINNVWVIVDPATGNAEIIGAVANTGRSADHLVSAAAGGQTATVRPATPAAAGAVLPNYGVTVSGDTVTVGGRSSVSFGQAARPELEIAGSSFRPGRLTQVDLDFANAGPVAISAQIMSNTGLFAEYDPNGPNVLVSASASASASASVRASASATASAHATASARATSSSSSASSPSSPSPSLSSSPSPTSS
jgi:hypothetical protein